MTATEMKPRMTAGLFCVCSMALQPSLYVAGWNPLPGLVMPVASGWQQPAAHRRVAQTALTRVGGPEIRAVRMSIISLSNVSDQTVGAHQGIEVTHVLPVLLNTKLLKFRQRMVFGCLC